MGNLDVAAFAGVNLRRDLLVNYGPYGQPGFLVKNVPPFQIETQSYDGERTVITTDIRHAGGSILDPTESAYQTLRRWIDNGATENNTGESTQQLERLPCSSTVPTAAGFDPNVDPQAKDFPTFSNKVNAVLSGSAGEQGRDGCAAGNCHGTSANELRLTCGTTPEQVRWNYFAASAYLAARPEESELLRRPLSLAQGGAYHEGGEIFSSTGDNRYQALLSWAGEHGPPKVTEESPAFRFFAHKVQPMLVKKGCMMLQCHSAAMFHDYRLRGGSGGSFSLSATKRNYELSLEQVALESDDPNASRLVAKNLHRPEALDGGRGILHRGGALFEDLPGPASGAQCAQANYDYDNAPLDSIPAYCVVREWILRERAEKKLSPLTAIVYVRRPLAAGPDRAQDFDTYAPGAELHLAKVDASLQTLDDRVANNGCGLDSPSADIRRPAVSWDGTRIAFAARTTAGEPFVIYEMNADGSQCQKHPVINATPASENGILIHNFDPEYSPPDGRGIVRLVFASTRGNAKNDAVYDYAGPQRSPADPSKPNANLYVFEPDPAQGGSTRVRQLTFLLNMERQPRFMRDGRLIFTTEKRAPGFYQLALRRINLDGGDYHPLFAQRGSIGFPQATNVVELATKNFAAVFSERDALHGGGRLGVFNRSVGIDFQSTDGRQYLLDPSVIDPMAPASPDPAFFLRSLRIVEPHFGGQKTPGVFAAPASLPDGRILVSFAPGADARTFGGDYDLFVVDPVTGETSRLLGANGAAEVDAVAIYARPASGLFTSTFDEPNGHTEVRPGALEADVTVLDFPVLASLLFQNTTTGRFVEPINRVDVYEDLPPPLDVASFEAGGGHVVSDEYGRVYVKRRLLGSTPLLADQSLHVRLPGGVPIVLKLGDTELSQQRQWPRLQREQMVFYPGEYAHQSFRKDFFNGLCGGCHGAISGKAIETAVRPDMLTQASRVLARDAAPVDLNLPPSRRGAPEGP